MELLPIPSHLKELLLIDKKKSSEYELNASLICCGCKFFFVEHSQNNYTCLVMAICLECNKEIVVFDSRFHGWNGYVCHLFREKTASDFVKENCRKCDESKFEIIVNISSAGKQDFIDGACYEYNEETQKMFDPEEWMDGFSWITIDLKCTKCGRGKRLINYETM